MEAAREWYVKHQTLKPIEKLRHEVALPASLRESRWTRLERRASNLLLKAIPEAQKEEVIASKNITVLGILTKLMVCYQPGGTQEKAAVLLALEQPGEATTISEALVGTRKWLRWKKRALDMNLVLPDPSILLRGLDRITMKVLSLNPTLQFKINLTRTTLMIDAVPTLRSIEQFAECLIAEMDQVSHLKKKTVQPQPKIKKFEEEGKPEGKKQEDEKKASPCKFFLTEEGCRRGKNCRWSHDQKDPTDQKRCWICGSTKHFSGKCPVKATGSPPKVAKAEKDKSEGKRPKAEDEDVQSNKAAMGSGEDMKSLLEEATKVLRSMPPSEAANDDGDAKIRNLQRQLDELKGVSLDSGATHALRPQLKNERVDMYPKVRKDCRVCQEAAAKGRPHRRMKLPPRAGVLSLDLAGPLQVCEDIHRKTAQYILVGTLTWPKDGIEPEYGEPGDDEEHLGPKFEDDAIEDQEEVQAKAMEVEEEEDLEELLNQGVTRAKRKGDDFEYEPTEPAQSDQEKEVAIAVHRLAIPLPSKSAPDLLRGVSEMVLTLKHEGFQVNQIHADRGGEFCGNTMAKRRLERGILQTFTAGVDPQGNGRAERAVQATKDQVRKTLRPANLGPDFWPLAVRHLNSAWRLQRIESKEKIPPFWAPVVVRKRYWKTMEFETRNETMNYICQSWQDHGHWVNKEDGQYVLTRAVISGTVEPLTDEKWIALERDLDHQEERRRIRGKSQVRRLSEATEEEKEERRRREASARNELAHIVSDDPEVAAIASEALRMFQEGGEEMEAEALQTKIVSPMEAKRKFEHWKKAIETEIEALFVTKKALRLLSPEEMKKLTEERGIIPLPSKVIFTVKPDPLLPAGKKKCRIVACGNYAPAEEHGEYFAAGADATSLRAALSMAARKKWIGINVDARTAFLNAPMQKETLEEDRDSDQAEEIILLKPAGILVQLGFFQAAQGWAVDKALYGFRQSPKRWSDHRDQEMTHLRVEDFFLVQMESESCIWAIRKEGEETVHGLILTYVDDLLVLSHEGLAEKWISAIQGVWETSAPEKVTEGKSTRFLGMELYRGFTGCWLASQEGYTKDLLLRNLGPDQKKWGHRRTPMARQDDDEGEDPGEDAGREEKAQRIKDAQRIVGELIWLVTRRRPDIMYVTSVMAANTAKNPLKVMKLGQHVWQYLAGSLKEGLVFSGQENEDLMVYTDASFGEDEAHGCVIIKWGDDPILWRSSRQGLLTTSTAEAELVEVMEGAITAEAIRVLLEEVMGDRMRCWQFTDSASAIAIITGDNASWRTRHLRRRAKYLRWKATKGDVVVRHQPGAEMVADIGTKPLLTAKFKELKLKIGMKGCEEKGEHEDHKKEVKVQSRGAPTEHPSQVLRLAVVVALLQRTKAQEEKEEEIIGKELELMILAYTITVILLTLMLQKAWTWFTQKRKKVEDQFPEVEPPTDKGSGGEVLPMPGLDPPTDRGSGGAVASMPGFDPPTDTGSGGAVTSMPGEDRFASPMRRTEEEEEEAEEEAPLPERQVTGNREQPSSTSSAVATNRVATVPTDLYVAGAGKCYHVHRQCTGVKLSRSVHSVKLCQICLERYNSWESGIHLFAKNGWHAMHTNEDHCKAVWPDNEIVRYRPCQVCMPTQYTSRTP